ncbi:MAG: HAMP domain-containing histidine kinase [Oscillospiraceae bacterium]|nr:HAMP domain-containing histidine kinase [Oscillospiraceae bacterium]
MNHVTKEQRKQAKQSVFPFSLFGVLFLVLLLMSGIHQGFLVLASRQKWNGLVQIIIPVIYWVLIALGLTAYTRWRIKKSYEEPMQMLARATAQVADGDFSVYVPPLHTADKLDYIDIMFIDFNKMVEELGSIETLKTDFFSNVTHEIKTPLAIIQNYAELLNREDLSVEKRMEYTQNILQATQRLSGLITNMLKLNKLEKQAIQPQPQPFDVCAQLCECALQFEELWEKKEIELEVDMDERVIISADEQLLELVWTNLLSNAMKFTPAGGTVAITQTTEEGSVVVTVSDTGCGMDEETMKHIFEKFYQGDTSHATEGNGLGLALVQRILQMSDGSITAASEPGKGTAFTVRLPLAPVGEGLE